VVLLLCIDLPVARVGGALVSPETRPADMARDEAVATRPAPRVPECFPARFTPDTLRAFLRDHPEHLPISMSSRQEQDAVAEALDRIDMGALIEGMKESLRRLLGDRLDLAGGLLVEPVPADRQILVDLSDIGAEPYRGPTHRVVGLLVEEVTEEEYVKIALRMMARARQFLRTGDPVYDRTHPDHLRAVAGREVAQIRARHAAEVATAKEREEIRKRIGKLLGVYDPKTGRFDGEPNWVKESRRFSYVVDARTGQFIDRLKPTVERINREMQLAGFPPPGPLDMPGIHFDPDLGDVEILLPKPMMKAFLAETDLLEQRMAEKAIITIEAIRLTDRDIVEGAVAARLNADLKGVHHVDRGFAARGVLRHLGINALLAIANQQLQIQQLNQVAAGAFPEATPLVSIAPVELPALLKTRTWTAVGGDFSIGSDPIFFDGREQTFGFTYVDPNGVQHTIGLDVVDSLRRFWSRIERNLIVHKIKKDPHIPLAKFSVPVGPESNTYEGLAALISQEDQNLIVATGTGAISQIGAKAGTWLIIQDFEIQPVPGSSTALTEEERRQLRLKTLLTMFLRDPKTPLEAKRRFLDAHTVDALEALLTDELERRRQELVSEGPASRTYGAVFEQRYAEVIDDASIKKKEENSIVQLTFYSSQGNIIQAPGATQLGSANDLTSLTTELRPNVVTPISSFVLKTMENTDSKSPLTGLSKGESQNEAANMAHLLVRTRFPTSEQEKRDLDEGRHLGYFKLPRGQEPLSTVSIPTMLSSEHPLERLASFRVGVMFDALQESKIRRPLNLFEPNYLGGTVSKGAWRAATTRLMLNRKIIGDTLDNDPSMISRFRRRFIAEVRSLLEYDPDFFDAPNIALRNMYHWNDPDRIVLALNHSPGRFALERLIKMLDELGALLVPDAYADAFLARSETRFLGGHTLAYLSVEELRSVRRDVANHFLRLGEAYGDAFLEAVSNILGLGTYRATKRSILEKGPLRGYADLVVFDRGGGAVASGAAFEAAHELFMTLKDGGIAGGLFEPSLTTLEDLDPESRAFIIRGADILK